MKNQFPKLLKILFIILILYLTLFLVLSPKSALSAADSAINLCLDTIIPSLFPFFVCSGLLSALGFSSLCSRFLSPIMRPLFSLPGSGAITFILGLVSGYPVGASSAADLYTSGQCTKCEAERMTAFCNNSGPLFVIAVVGQSFLGNVRFGYILYASHILSAILVGLIFRFYKDSGNNISLTLPPAPQMGIKNAALGLGSVIDNSVFSTLKVCGFVLFFAVLTNSIPSSPLTPFVYSFLEITGGINLLSQLDMALNIKLSIISFFLAFSGLSVVFQVSSIILPRGISLWPYIWGKFMQGIFSFVITFILVKKFPISQTVFSSNPNFTPLRCSLTSIVSVLVVVFVLSIFCLISFKKATKKPLG